MHFFTSQDDEFLHESRQDESDGPYEETTLVQERGRTRGQGRARGKGEERGHESDEATELLLKPIAFLPR